jgi:hypothetical protein
MKTFKKIYWLVAVLAFIAAVYYAPQMVEYEWGVGAYIAIGWGIFVLIFGIIGMFAPQIEKRWLKKK